MIKAIIFDCFGVIISDGLEAVLARLKKTNPEAREHVGDIIRANNRGLLEPAETKRQIADYLGITVEEWHSQVDAGEFKDPSVTDWILELHKDYKTALLSNIGKGSMSRRFSDEELRAYFDEVVVSGEVGIVKPNPDIYHLTARRLGVLPPECVFIDDREGFCEAAQQVGMRAIVFDNLDQAKHDLRDLLAADSKN